MLAHSINLLSNAIKYSPPGSTVHFELVSQDDEVIFEIKDEGSIEDQRLFESFHRATNVKTFPVPTRTNYRQKVH